jgi:hypothetical protein
VLSGISGGVLAAQTTATVSIVDDDPLPPHSIGGQVTVDGVGLSGVDIRGSDGAICAATDAGGYYSCEIAQGWSGSIWPSAPGYSFEPASRGYSDLQASQSGQDFSATALVETVWIEDADLPSGSVVSEYGWGWSSSGAVAPFSGGKALYSPVRAGMHRHLNLRVAAADDLPVAAGEVLYTYVWLDPANPPRSIMVAYGATGASTEWEHRAYWGENLILPGHGVDGTAGRLPMGPLPAAGGWVRLAVAAADLDLAGATVTTVGVYAYDGRVAFDRFGKASGP